MEEAKQAFANYAAYHRMPMRFQATMDAGRGATATRKETTQQEGLPYTLRRDNGVEEPLQVPQDQITEPTQSKGGPGHPKGSENRQRAENWHLCRWRTKGPRGSNPARRGVA
ncbi:uncharacterized protein N7515_004029 [Penicillium bovifimosum]|uniref:Uncharacterized protein n=1 Tax=Penicillium bovifimosum TaxID=126998 RepID=A0A9W9H684_9EURO|nr:uncharacterized protein N7515_004029 [Penicillium bovifimosum]KAJ5139181.1 hypothetical protein N7515_004029 [Penicillium bovifimosum]